MATLSSNLLLTARDLEILTALDRCPLTAEQLLKLSQIFAAPFTSERRVRERGADFPDRLEDWNTYLFFLRDHATIDGSLPSTFDGLIVEVFADVLDDRSSPSV